MGIVASALCCCSSACLGSASCCFKAGQGANAMGRQAAKGAYVSLLGFGTILAWVLQRYGKQGDFEVGQLDFKCDGSDGDNVCSDNGIVYRISFMLTCFFSLCMLGSVPFPTMSGERRFAPLFGDGFQQGFWAFKLLLFIALLGLTALLPSSMFDTDENWYAWVARIASGFFLVLQVLTLIDFGFQWNEDWVARGYDGGDEPVNKGWLVGVILAALFLNGVGLAGIVLMFLNYGDCPGSNLYLIITIIAYAVYTIPLTLFREQIIGQPGAVLPASVVAAYTSFLCWSAIENLPEAGCRPFDNGSDLVVFAGIAFATISLVWTSYTASSRTQALLGGKEEGSDQVVAAGGSGFGGLYAVGTDENGKEILARDTAKRTQPPEGGEGDDTNKNAKLDDKPWMFHGFMVLGSMYMAMLLTNWGVRDANAVGQNQNVGELSFWVKIVSEWFCILLFLWVLVAPRILSGRDFTY